VFVDVMIDDADADDAGCGGNAKDDTNADADADAEGIDAMMMGILALMSSKR
jgi:hypothetical protein